MGWQAGLVVSKRDTHFDPTRWDTPRRGSEPRGTRWHTTEIAAVFALSVACAVLAAFRLGGPSFWLDEGASWAMAGHGLGDVFDTIRNADPNGSAYLSVLHGWIVAFGDSETAIRSLSVVMAAATVAPFYALARRVLPRGRVALGATALFAVSPFVLLYARDARMYTFALFFTVLASYAFVRGVEESSARWWAIWAVFVAVGVAAHFFVALAALAQLASLAALPGEARPRFRVIVSGVGLLALLCVPLGVLAVSMGSGQISWIAPLNASELHGYVNTLVGSSIALWLPWIAVCAAALLAARMTVRREGARSIETWHLVFAFALLLVPLVATIAISVVEPVFVPYYLIVTVPGFVLVLGFGLSWLDARRSGALAIGAAVLIACSVWNARSFWEGSQAREDWRATVALVARGYQPGDTIMLAPDYAIYPFGYYAHRSPVLESPDVRRLPDRPWDVTFASNLAPLTSVVPASAGDHVWLVVLYASRSGTATGSRQAESDLATLRHRLESASSRIERHNFRGDISVWRYTLTRST